ncbi:MAG: hypothetical protein Q8N51_15985 [Gammaproteobacteria bacterium]|nr:hypothetical protein [Gammaproteobacteria bacterium]
MFSVPPAATPGSRSAGLLGATGVLLTGLLAFQLSLPPVAPTVAPATAGGDGPCTLRPPGYLRGRFFGAVNLTANWSGKNLLCDGMPKPGGEGVRLFFAGEQPGGGRLSVLIAIDGRPDGLAGAERPANVTVIDERAGRFFGTSGKGRCWTSIGSVTALARSRDYPAGHRIEGMLYCLGALPSLGDRASLTLGDLHFAGRISADED